MGAEIPATLHLRQKVYVHEKITCVCKQAKNHRAPHPLGGGVPCKSDGFQGFKYIVCYLLESLILKCIYQHLNGLGTFWVLAGKNVSWTTYQQINFWNWYLLGVDSF